MIPLAFGFVWLGYSYGLYGWCLIKGYDVKLSQLMNPRTIYQWPPGGPPVMAPTTIFPNGQNAQATTPGGGSKPSAPGSGDDGICPPGSLKVNFPFIGPRCVPIPKL